MGTISSVLVVAAGSGGVLTVLARSLSVWIAQQRSHVTLTIQDSDKPSLVLDVTNVKDPETLIRNYLSSQSE